MSVRSSVKVGKNTLRSIVKASKESTTRPGSAMPLNVLSGGLNSHERSPKNSRFGNKVPRAIMSGTVKPHHKDE